MEHLSHYPSVSVVVPARNAADGLRTTLPAILAQEYAGSIEVIVADGSDTEETAELIRQHFPTVRLVPNPNYTISTGLNRAIAASTGEVVVRCDAYALLPLGYVQRAVKTLIRTGSASVGGRQYAVGDTFVERAVALGQNIPLGVGCPLHRLGGKDGPTETVYLGVFRRDVLEAVGKFDPTLLRNEDYVLNWKIRKIGGIVWFDSKLVVKYRPRENLRALGKQYFASGRWKSVVTLRYPESTLPRHVAGPLLTVGLVASAAGVLSGIPLVWVGIFPLTYLLVLLSEAVRVGIRRRDSAAVVLPLVLMIMHLSWGVGFYCPLLSVLKQGRTRCRQPFSGKAAVWTSPSISLEAPSLEMPISVPWPAEQAASLANVVEHVTAAGSRLSVVILAWNSVGKIEPCLEALLQGTWVPDEIIVVDNDSKDQTRAVLAMRFPSVRVIENTINRGVAPARNQGLVAARGTYVLVLDDDTIMQPEALARLVAVLDASPTVALCGPQLLNTAHEPISTPLTFPTLAHKARRWGRAERRNGGPWDNSLSGRMREVDYVIGACQLIRRAALDEVGLYDEHIFYGPEDIDFCLRLRQAGWRIVIQPAAQVIHAEQRIARSVFSPIGRKHISGLAHYFWKHRYGLSQSRLYERLPTFSPVSHSL